MPRIGLKRFRYGLLNPDGITYGQSKTLGGAIQASVSPNFVEASLYCDNSMKEYVSSFQSASVSLTTDDDDDEIFSELLGRNYDEQTKIVSSSTNDTPPYVGCGYLVNKIKNNIMRWRAQFFTKVKFKAFIPEAKTTGDSIEFAPITVEGITIANELGIWEQHVEVATEAEAEQELEKFFENGGI